ncbi:tRNA pseudouridine(55) synthase TruB [Clostridium sp. MSJ-11]|uniref:tRNA pseudouridine synthase B n=1 Tax=Clostridium mobile TaxID=2841512 RepID=A0ABS6EC65_9CLOT|nr:tRNA pseudouridine(55) synthase TruB [Clostridium mobile]MBU5482789.1 tRNA pseudouridine(55) synthase TruB [Clostridium mobile]
MNGVLNIFKPSGITSFDVVRMVKKAANTKKVGHTGTLDPMASGVLPICLGNATKIVDYIMNESKIYKSTLKLGVVTDTYDKEGKILKEETVDLEPKIVEECIKSFQGSIDQVPPMYSALKVNGKRLYQLAREGIEVERKARKINIYSIDILNIDLPYVTFQVHCSKGTYIRSLCYDIGEKLGVGASMWALERVKTGIFNIKDALHIDNLNNQNINEYLVPIDEALSKYESITIEEVYEKLLVNGVLIKDKRIMGNIKKDVILRVYSGNKFIGLGRRSEEGFKILKLLV